MKIPILSLKRGFQNKLQKILILWGVYFLQLQLEFSLFMSSLGHFKGIFLKMSKNKTCPKSKIWKINAFWLLYNPKKVSYFLRNPIFLFFLKCGFPFSKLLGGKNNFFISHPPDIQFSRSFGSISSFNLRIPNAWIFQHTIL